MRKLWVLGIAIAAFVSAAPAQEASGTAGNQAIEKLLQRVDALEKRVQELEAQNKQLMTQQTPATAASTATEHATAVTPAQASQEHPGQQAEIHEHGSQLGGMPGAPESYPNLKVRGFADVDFSAVDTKTQTNGFSMGQFVLHFSSALSPKVSFFGEVSFTAQPTGYSLDVERSIIRYDANDYLKVSFGRYHTPINYWNTAFHHGAWLQTTIARPEMARFGGRFLPIHFVGALAEGAIPSGPLGLNYNFGVGNGRQTLSVMSRDGDAGDVNSNRAWVASVFAKPARLFGLQVGGSVYHDLISPDTTTAGQPHYKELISAAHIVWSKENPEFIAEFANVHHEDAITRRDWNSQGTYAQVAYRLPWQQRKWKPYYRFEYIHVPATEPVLLVPNLTGHTAGTRFDITDFAAFKFEYRSQQRTDTQRSNGFYAQTAFTF